MKSSTTWIKSPAPWLAFILLAPVATPPTLAGEPEKSFFADGFAARAPNRAPIGWTNWSPRAEIAPTFAHDRKVGREAAGSLGIAAGGNPAAFGGWRRQVDTLEGGKTYRFVAWFRCKSVPNPRRSVIARLEWLDQEGKTTRPPDYAIDVGREGEWTRVEYTTPVPANTRKVDIWLCLGFTAKGVVWWDDVQVRQLPEPPRRPVRVVAVHHRPAGTGSAAKSVEQFCQLAESAESQHPDLVCLPEGITVVGTGQGYAEVSEPVPGPTVQRLGQLSARLRAYVVAGVYERADKRVYNTAVLLDRQGRLVGKYRKTHLPREEWENGITPGEAYPVFDTDFGRIGLLICWDLQFPEAARALGVKGAELICLPIWGGSEVLARARAIENHLYLVTATYDMRTFIVDPAGKVLAEGAKEHPLAVAEIDLAQKILQPWLGDMKTRTWKERRPDLPID
jgi:predicted amidohydrolase